MTNNAILRQLRYIFDYNDRKMLTIFAQAGGIVTREQLTHWLRKEDDPTYLNCPDLQLATFLNGLINECRGKREGEQIKPEKKLNNNLILRKLKIALDLKNDDILAILLLADLRISKHELTALFRRSDHKHFRLCKDQILRNFLKGLQIKLRPSEPTSSFKWK